MADETTTETTEEAKASEETAAEETTEKVEASETDWKAEARKWEKRAKAATAAEKAEVEDILANVPAIAYERVGLVRAGARKFGRGLTRTARPAGRIAAATSTRPENNP